MRSWCLALALTLSGVALAARPCPAAEPGRYALLVGCTRYENQSPQLDGPGNDVLLMRDLLTGRYHFPPEDVVILSEASGKRPTRAHIEEEFRRLADRAHAGDRVVILLAGHGCREPDTRPDDPEHFTTDGKEAVFLPCDAGARDDFDPRTGTLRNAIPDYEFRGWLGAIRAKGASIWVIVDACHSAGLVRNDRGVVRAVPDVGPLPPEIRQMVEARIKGKAPAAPPDPRQRRSPLKLAPDAPDLVAVYAAQATEQTIENRMPPDADDPPPVVHGLLTYTLCRVLTQARTSLTYTELVQRIQDLYAGWCPVFPTPLVEGKDQDRVVLGDGERRGRSRVRLLADPAGGWKVNAGSLAGLTAGTILAVYPQAGDPGAEQKLLGYVEVPRDGLRPLDAKVRPVAHNGLPVPQALPERGRCEVAFLDYGDMRLRVAVDDRTGADEQVPDARRQRLHAALERLAGDKGSILAVTASPREAEWLLRVDAPASDKVYLLPAGAALRARPAVPESGPPPPVFGPLPAAEDDLAGWLKDRLERIARAQRLLALATDDRKALVSDDEPLKVGIRLVRVRGDEELPLGGGPGEPIAYPGDRLRVEITNEGRLAVDVTVLFVDSKYGIAALFPRSKTDNRILPGDSTQAGGSLNLDDGDAGREHLVVIAARARRQQEYANFTFLAQPNLDKSREEAHAGSRATQEVFNSPFGKLLQQAFYGNGARGEPAEAASDYVLGHVSWQVAPGKRPAGEGP